MVPQDEHGLLQVDGTAHHEVDLLRRQVVVAHLIRGGLEAHPLRGVLDLLGPRGGPLSGPRLSEVSCLGSRLRRPSLRLPAPQGYRNGGGRSARSCRDLGGLAVAEAPGAMLALQASGAER